MRLLYRTLHSAARRSMIFCDPAIGLGLTLSPILVHIIVSSSQWLSQLTKTKKKNLPSIELCMLSSKALGWSSLPSTSVPFPGTMLMSIGVNPSLKPGFEITAEVFRYRKNWRKKTKKFSMRLTSYYTFQIKFLGKLILVTRALYY